MRRGLLRDLANTPTAIACGWRLYEDIERLTSLVGRVVTIDLLRGTSRVGDEVLEPPLGITHDTTAWMRERLDRDGIPSGLVTGASLTLTPREERGLVVACCTVVVTRDAVYESRDVAAWREG